MKNPTPINQLPRFVETLKGTRKEASNEWLSIIIIGGFFAISLYVLKKLLNEPNLKKEEEPDNFNDKSYNCQKL
jgi:hypothetical protein